MHQNDTIIKAGPIRVNVSPYGFFHYGKEFFDTAKAFQQSAHFSPVPYYLFCHAIELLLKAFLLANGVPKKDLPRRDLYGHDLGKILRKANELGLGEVVTITQEQEREIERANKYYVSKGFEYFSVIKAVRAYPELPDLSVLKQVASTLLTKLEAICLNAD
jgi:HEPN domain-containing protein